MLREMLYEDSAHSDGAGDFRTGQEPARGHLELFSASLMGSSWDTGSPRQFPSPEVRVPCPLGSALALTWHKGAMGPRSVALLSWPRSPYWQHEGTGLVEHQKLGVLLL